MPRSGCAPVPSLFDHGRAAGTVPVCMKGRAILSGCRLKVAARLRPSNAGATGRLPLGLAQGTLGRLARCGVSG